MSITKTGRSCSVRRSVIIREKTQRKEVVFPESVGLDWDVLDIMPYSADWPEVFRREADYLQSAFHPWFLEHGLK